MRVVYSRCAGVDVHKKTVVACRRWSDGPGGVQSETRTFGTMTGELLTMLDWLSEWEVSHVTMESTGDYWKPLFNLLEGQVEVLLVNAQHVKHVPGRKSDVADAEWLAELLSYGLLKASFIPPKPQRDLRDLTRYRRTLVEERARLVNRVQKLLETANIKLASVATDVLGVSGRAMLRAMAAGERDSEALAELARGRLRQKLPQLQQALRGLMDAHHSYLLAQQLAHIDFLDEQIADISQEIARRLATMVPPTSSLAPPPAADEGERPLAWMAAVALLDTAPGIDERAAQAILAEIGLDMAQFPTPAHLASWAGVAPRTHQSGGKRYPSRTAKGNQTLRTTLVQAAWAAARTKSSYLHSLYHRLAARRGKKRALVAIAHSLLCSIHVMLTRHLPYADLGADYFDRRRKPFQVERLVGQLAQLGYAALLEPLPATV